MTLKSYRAQPASPIQEAHFIAYVDLKPIGTISQNAPLSLSGWASQQNTGSILIGILKAALKGWWDQQRLYGKLVFSSIKAG
ncbi:hypothetical protein BTJ40_05770 [Microbulbifer sp. A4B17]|nr:hypothetical protein BTJ40_05770 [Microbulbifer sp. A4B17]